MNDNDSADTTAEANEDPSPRHNHHSRWRILRSTAMLPSFVTILNGLAGLGAIHFATKDAIGTLSASSLGNMSVAAWLIGLAMVFDMLDGRLARMTRRTTEFGAQLDSLCDAISFGVAPAIIMLRLVAASLKGIEGLSPHWNLQRIAWSVAAFYVACGVVRLARFNVETEADESAHMDFRGLPIPGAAASVVSLVLLFPWLLPRLIGDVWDAGGQWQGDTWFLVAAVWILIGVTATAAYLMVSEFKYAHLVNHYIRGKRPLSYLIKCVIIILALWWFPIVTLAAGTNIYALSGPARAAWRRLRPGDRNEQEQTPDK